jgi:hypothetical protein
LDIPKRQIGAADALIANVTAVADAARGDLEILRSARQREQQETFYEKNDQTGNGGRRRGGAAGLRIYHLGAHH